MTEPDRPNPDVMLAALQKADARRGRGRLKVFLGMAPGVGKTYAMLEAARRELAAGRDVVAALIETHQRAETARLLEGLPQMPRRAVEYRGVELSELDLDAVLARRPQLVLVDELAHSNAPGSRHPKRCQDVLEILDAGIDVFTTLNVQHIESRAEAVRQITGTVIRETLPDTTLDGAEFELVDLPPEELRERLAAGKVYLAESAREAREGFFRPGNLAALRELALRFAAEHVGQDLIAYRQERGIGDPWRSGTRLLVAVSPSPTSASLVRWTKRLAGELQASWVAVHVELPRPMSPEDRGRLARHLAMARELGAQVITTTDTDVARGVLRVGREQNVAQIVVGKPAGWRAIDLLRGGALLNRLIRESGSVDIHAVRPEGEEPPRRRPVILLPAAGDARGYAGALGVVAGVTALNALLDRWLHYPALALVYLLSVVVLAMFTARGPTLLAACLTAFIWDFLFVPPKFTPWITRPEDLMMFFTLLVVGLAMGHLAARLRAQQAAERRREEHATTMYLFTRELAQAADYTSLLAVIVREVGRAVRARIALSVPSSGDGGGLTAYFAGTWTLSEKEQGVADWAFRRGQPAGLGTDTLPSAEGLHEPLLAGDHPVGVLSVKFQDAGPLEPGRRDLLDALVRQTALVLDRQRLRDAEQQAKMIAESDRLSRTLLNSISHEIRTPLAVINSAAGSLGEARRGGATPPWAMLDEIQEATARLNRLVGNLLNITRLESGHVKPRLDWCDVADLIQVTLKHIERECARHAVTTVVAPGLPLARMDFVLMEQALANLVLNACAHTPPGTAVEIRASASGDRLQLVVADRGPGVPVDSIPHLFDKFYRAPNAPAGGTGLGLAIVRGLVDAHGGVVEAGNQAGGGACFTIHLPLVKPPPLLPETSP